MSYWLGQESGWKGKFIGWNGVRRDENLSQVQEDVLSVKMEDELVGNIGFLQIPKSNSRTQNTFISIRSMSTSKTS